MEHGEATGELDGSREREFLLGLAACVGSSPRRIKRFVNISRIIKAACPAEERSGFVVDTGASGSHRAALTLLALTTGAPHLANLIFARIKQAGDDRRVAALREELEQENAFDPREAAPALGALRRYEHAEGGDAALADLRRWQRTIGRFTFRLGRY